MLYPLGGCLLFIAFAHFLAPVASFSALDRDRNGFGDLWEAAFGPGRENIDADGDGFTDAQESLAGTDPKDYNSALRLLSLVTLPENRAKLRFSTVLGKRYAEEVSPDLLSWTEALSIIGDGFISSAEVDLADPNISRVGFALPHLVVDGRFFFRVKASDIDLDEDGVSNFEEGLAGLDPLNPMTVPGRNDLESLITLLDAPSTVTFAPPLGRAVEPTRRIDHGASGESGLISVRRSGGIRPLRVTYSVSGTAVGGVDYRSLSGVVHLAAWQDQAWISVLPLFDQAIEPADFVTLRLEPSPAEYTIGAVDQANVVIEDPPDALQPSVPVVPYAPAPEWQMGLSGSANSWQYLHDASHEWHRGEWWLGANANLEFNEGVAGQVNVFARSPDWKELGRGGAVAHFTSPNYSTNPVPVDVGLQWHPSLLRLNDRLECWWFTSGISEIVQARAASNRFWLSPRGVKHGRRDGDAITVTKRTGLSGLTDGLFYVVNANPFDYQLANSPEGPPVNLGSDGTATVQSGRATGFRSKWDDATRKWTHSKIQLGLDGKVRFGGNVSNSEADDRVTLASVSYAPFPLTKPIRGFHGRLVMPLTLTNATHNGIGTANRTTVMWSDDNGETWHWPVATIPFSPASYRNNQWEPWMTWDGLTYRAWFRNFNSPGVGKGYSVATSPDLVNWSPAVDAAFDVMPMRGVSEAESGFWFVFLADRPLARPDWSSNERRPVVLWRSRNGSDWLPLAAAFPTWLNTRYCWPVARDGHIYLSASAAGGIALAKMPLPPSNPVVSPRHAIEVTAIKSPPIRNGRYELLGFDYAKIPVTFSHGSGWSFAYLGHLQQFRANLGLDTHKPAQESSVWGHGLMAVYDGYLMPQLSGMNVPGNLAITDPNALKTIPVSNDARGLISWSWDESDAKLRGVYIDAVTGRLYHAEWAVRRFTQVAAPQAGDSCQVNGRTYTFERPVGRTATVEAASDVLTVAYSGLADGARVWFLPSHGAEGWTAGSLAYVVNATGNTLQLAQEPGGLPFNFTSDGTGTLATTSGPTRVPVFAGSYGQLNALRSTVLAHDPGVLSPQVSGAWHNPSFGVRTSVWWFLPVDLGATMAGGARLVSQGNIFDVPKTSVTLSGSNTAADPSVQNKAGLAFHRFALWNSRLTVDDIRALWNETQPINQGAVLPTASTKSWSSADLLADAAAHNPALFSADPIGHLATVKDDFVFLPGDAAAAVEVPGSGDWRLHGEFMFDAFPEGMEWDLLTVGDKLSLARLTVVRSGTDYFLNFLGIQVARVEPGKWLPLELAYSAATNLPVLLSPGFQNMGPQRRPVVQLGRFFANVDKLLLINRPSNYATNWRALRVIGVSEATTR